MNEGENEPELERRRRSNQTERMQRGVMNYLSMDRPDLQTSAKRDVDGGVEAQKKGSAQSCETLKVSEGPDTFDT